MLSWWIRFRLGVRRMWRWGRVGRMGVVEVMRVVEVMGLGWKVRGISKLRQLSTPHKNPPHLQTSSPTNHPNPPNPINSAAFTSTTNNTIAIFNLTRTDSRESSNYNCRRIHYSNQARSQISKNWNSRYWNSWIVTTSMGHLRMSCNCSWTWTRKVGISLGRSCSW